MTDGLPRIGVLACSCWSRSETGIDADTIVAETVTMPGVVHAEATDDLCGAGNMVLAGDLVKRHTLDRLVVAACACCSQAQRCAACNDERAGLREAVKDASRIPWAHHAFVNVKDHGKSTRDSVTMVAMAIAAMGQAPDDVPPRATSDPVRAALVVGAGRLGRATAVELGERGVPTHLVDGSAPVGVGSTAPENITLHMPARVISLRGGGGDFTVVLARLGDEVELRVGTVLVAPGLAEQEREAGVGWGLPHRSMDRPPRKVQGVFLVGEDGRSAAGTAAAYLGRRARGTAALARVEPEACIGCLKCVRVCPYGAIDLVDGQGVVSVDPQLCAGCGACPSACMNWAVEQAGYTTRELEAAIGVGASRTPNLLITCNWSAYRAMDQAYQDDLLPKGLAPLRLPCLARLSPHLVQVALGAGADPVIMAGCSERGCHFRDRRALVEDHMRNMEASLSSSGDLERIFVLTLGPTDKDVLATRVISAVEERRYEREETGVVRERDGPWARGWGV
ncbi:MAG: hydrogenase iron-sulfur subunit [Thermoplasmata archaeon]|nr:MAG: hydrogenase iron-sulfur subunit [Thermoplasmata archaeon]